MNLLQRIIIFVMTKSNNHVVMWFYKEIKNPIKSKLSVPGHFSETLNVNMNVCTIDGFSKLLSYYKNKQKTNNF